MAESLYRKYRPQTFEDVVGQEHIERTLKNAIDQDKVSHAYLFCGPRGTGKTTTARLLAKALLCQSGPSSNPDGSCEDCRLIAAGEHPDVNELDAASRTGVENVREEIIGRVQYAPVRGRHKIYIIDEVHMLSTAAFNALLKTLEEPPAHVVFILCTTDPQRVPETIHSRCQRFDFRRISNEAILARLGAVCVSEGVEFEGEALDLIAHRAEGGMRNALTSLEQIMAFSEGFVSLEAAERMLGSLDSSELSEIVEAIAKRDIAACFRWTASFMETGADLGQFVLDLAGRIRNLYVFSLTETEAALEVSAGELRELEAELDLFTPNRLARLLDLLGQLSAELKTSTNQRLSFEIALTKMLRPDSDLSLEALLERIEALEADLSALSEAGQMQAQELAQGLSCGQGVSAANSAATGAGEAMPYTQASVSGGPSVERRSFAEEAAVFSEPFSLNEHTSAFEVAEEGRRRVQDQTQEQGQAGTQDQISAQNQAGMQGQTSGTIPEELLARLSNPASLQRLWQAALAALKKEKAAYAVLFLNTKAVFDAGQKSFLVEFPAENIFAFKAAQKPEVQDAILRALQHSCKVQLPLVFVQGRHRLDISSEANIQTEVVYHSPETQQPRQARPEQDFHTPYSSFDPQQEPDLRASAVPQQAVQPQQPTQEAQQIPQGQQEQKAQQAPVSQERKEFQQSQERQEPQQVQTSQQAQASQQVQVSQNTSQVQEVDLDDLRAILEAGFGDGVKLEEVRE